MFLQNINNIKNKQRFSSYLKKECKLKKVAVKKRVTTVFCRSAGYFYKKKCFLLQDQVSYFSTGVESKQKDYI